MKVRDWIDLISRPTEDASLHPQAAEAATPMLIYDYLMIARDSLVYVSEEGRIINGQEVDSYFLKCIEIERVDKNECPRNPSSGCYWFKTKKPIPEYHGDITITNTKGDVIDFTSWADISDNDSSYSPLFADSISWTERRTPEGNYIYLDIPGDWDPEWISAHGSFYDFQKMLEYSDCESGESICNMLDQELHVNPRYKLDLIRTTVSLIHGFFGLTAISHGKTDERDGSKEINEA